MFTSQRTVLALLLACAASACASRAPSGGAEASPAMSAAPRTADAAALPAGATSEMVAAGSQLFNQGACQRCHGVNGVGGANGPSLVRGPWLHQRGSLEELTALIVRGVPQASLKDPARRFGMNPRGGPMNLTDQQAATVAAYVWSISRGKG